MIGLLMEGDKLMCDGFKIIRNQINTCTMIYINRGGAFVPKLNIVEETPSDDLRNKNHIMAAPAQVMYIMADLGPKDR